MSEGFCGSIKQFFLTAFVEASLSTPPPYYNHPHAAPVFVLQRICSSPLTSTVPLTQSTANDFRRILATLSPPMGDCLRNPPCSDFAEAFQADSFGYEESSQIYRLSRRYSTSLTKAAHSSKSRRLQLEARTSDAR